MTMPHRPRQHTEPMGRLTHRTVATTRRGPRGVVTTTEHYAVASEGATDEQLDDLLRKLNGILAAVRKHTRG